MSDRKLTMLNAALAAALATVACSGDDDDDTSARPTAPAAASSTTRRTPTSTNDEASQAVVADCALTDGLVAPESIVYDTATRAWYVSNGGAQGPGDGFISKLDASGKMLNVKFATGLDDPKGIALHEGKLYVADVSKLVVVDVDKPGTIERIEIAGAMFLNDVAVDPTSGDVFVSDTFADRVYRVRDENVSVLAQGGMLHAPNGLLFDHDTLWVASMGPDLDRMTFQTSAAGRLLLLDLAADNEVSSASDPLGSLDGIAAFGGDFLVSDTFRGVFQVPRDGKARMLISAETLDLTSWADIGVGNSGSMLAIPDLFGTRVAFCDLH